MCLILGLLSVLDKGSEAYGTCVCVDMGISVISAAQIGIAVMIYNSVLELKLKLSRYTPRRRLGERRYSSYSLSNSALDGMSGQRHAPSRALVPVKGLPVTIVQGAGSAPELVWTQRLEEKSSACAVDRT
jgi:hypothetical protein